MTPFLGRLFPTVDGRFQCDRCRRTYDTLIEAAECPGPNHSQIRGAVVRRTHTDYAAKACGRRITEDDPTPPRNKGGRPRLYATDDEQYAAHRAQKRAYAARKSAAMTPDEHEARLAERRRRDRERAAEYRRQNADDVRQRERERSRRRREADPDAAREAVRRSREKWA